MTAQEKDRIESAIRHIKTATDIDPWAMELAVEALEKQIPKEPLPKKLLTESVGILPVYGIPCGSCGELVSKRHNYCGWCGPVSRFSAN